ncbi:transcription termination factor Rho [Horticoccus luteus]|uniref:Transcription termination factor Rho n=2 Tax=Horticoccus luteus TaxID=2862869 RepID=A0A8F9TYY1_9BACT|nr:transcription termination factor Rho [Horticoccus luteus]
MEAAPSESRPEDAPRRDESAGGNGPGSDTNRGNGGGAPAGESGAGHSQHGDRGQPGGDNYGGGEQGGGYWKQRRRDKRKRGRHGGQPWQPGPGGGGGGGGQHFQPKPPQPPPPNFAPTFGDLPDPAGFNDLAALDRRADEIATGGSPIFIDELYALNHADLTALARANGVHFDGVPTRLQMLEGVFKMAAEQKRELRDRGWLDLTDRGYGFIVHKSVNYRLYPENTYVPESLVHRYGLKRGHEIEVRVQAPHGDERCPSAVRIESVMGAAPEQIASLTPFEELIPYYPLKRILLEAPEVQKDVSMRAVDILTPIGFGQRGLIVAPPRTGKTVLLQNIANSVSENFPEAKLILLLIDERPEEVTDFKRHTKGEVVSSTFDESPESHVHAAEMVGEKARRLVEQGEHVVILLDSITRLARAYNALTGNQGKTMSGGLESNALQKPKRFFGAARNIEGAGSLTIIGTALIDTGSRMDEIIFEEFKGTGNSELHLDRGLVERRIFPAINIDRSGTRKEELIYHPDELQRIHGLRRAMQGLGPIESMEMLITRLKKTNSNAEFLLALGKQ